MNTIQKNNFKPIYIVGNSRSGTTIMAIILRQNKEIFSFRELHFFEQLWSQKDKHKVYSRNEVEHLGARLLCLQREGYYLCRNHTTYLDESKNILRELNDNDLTFMNTYKTFLLYETRRNDKFYPCEQTPRNIFYIQEILESFPDARIIHMVRDPRAILLSQKNKWKRGRLGKKISVMETIRSWVNYHPIVIGKLWNAAVRAGCRFKYDSRVFTVRFEDFLQQPQETLQKICNFLEVQYQDNMLDVAQVGSSNISDNPERRGINPEVSDYWKKNLNATDIYWCQKINKSLMETYGYTLTDINFHFLNLSLSILVLPFKMLFALLLNLKRTKNLVCALKKRFV